MRSITASLKTFAALTCAFLGMVGMAFGDTQVTFQVDMSVQIGNGSFNPGNGDKVTAAGTFNGWNSTATPLTNNPSSADTNVYTATFDDTTDANGGVMDYKYVINGSTYENTLDGNNRCAFLPTNSGASLTLDLCTWGDAGNDITNSITFQVDMAQQINLGNFTPGTTSIYAQGSFEGWNDSFPLTNDPTILRTNQFGLVSSNVYVGTYAWGGAPIGGTAQYKFVMNNGSDNYENPTKGDPDNNNNRFFDQPGTNTSLTLPIVFFSDQAFAPLVTNAVTFKVDMSAQILSGAFGSPYQVSVNGQFNNWSSGVDNLTNDPDAPDTNLYTGTFYITNGVGSPAVEQYKFTDNNGNYESLSPNTPQIGGNRYFDLADNASSSNVVTVLPVVSFSDVEASDLLPADTIVQFSVNMTNAVQYGTSIAFGGGDSVYINGDFLGWPTWSAALPQLDQVGDSLIYETDTNVSYFLFAKGSPVVVNYKYSIDGSDDEAGFGQNHTRYIRATGFYAMPTDIFGDALSEPSFGNLAIGKPAGGKAPITWLGRPGVHLQVSTSASGGWVDHPETDGLSATNYPVGSTSLYFRLVHPSE